MYKNFVKSIKKNGRVSEFQMMMGYYMSTNPFAALGMISVAWNLLSHGRMPLSAKKIKGKKDLDKIIKKLNEVRVPNEELYIFPGCSSEATAVGLDISTRAIAEVLGMELKELEDWNCCGSTPYGSLDETESIVIAARNLALAEKQGWIWLPPQFVFCNIEQGQDSHDGKTAIEREGQCRSGSC